MSRAYWAHPRTDAELDRHLVGLITLLDDWGPVASADEATSLHRKVRVQVRIPTVEVPGMRIVLSEDFARDARTWSLSEYQYNVVDEGGRRFFGFHHHPLPRLTGADDAITHVHCRSSGDTGDHFRGTWVTAEEAFWDFVQWAAEPIRFPECGALRPLV